MALTDAQKIVEHFHKTVHQKAGIKSESVDVVFLETPTDVKLAEELLQKYKKTKIINSHIKNIIELESGNFKNLVDISPNLYDALKRQSVADEVKQKDVSKNLDFVYESLKDKYDLEVVAHGERIAETLDSDKLLEFKDLATKQMDESGDQLLSEKIKATFILRNTHALIAKDDGFPDLDTWIKEHPEYLAAQSAEEPRPDVKAPEMGSYTANSFGSIPTTKSVKKEEKPAVKQVSMDVYTKILAHNPSKSSLTVDAYPLTGKQGSIDVVIERKVSSRTNYREDLRYQGNIIDQRFYDHNPIEPNEEKNYTPFIIINKAYVHNDSFATAQYIHGNPKNSQYMNGLLTLTEMPNIVNEINKPVKHVQLWDPKAYSATEALEMVKDLRGSPQDMFPTFDEDVKIETAPAFKGFSFRVVRNDKIVDVFNTMFWHMDEKRPLNVDDYITAHNIVSGHTASRLPNDYRIEAVFCQVAKIEPYVSDGLHSSILSKMVHVDHKYGQYGGQQAAKGCISLVNSEDRGLSVIDLHVSGAKSNVHEQVKTVDSQNLLYVDMDEAAKKKEKVATKDEMADHSPS